MKEKINKYTIGTLGLVSFLFLAAFPPVLQAQTSPEPGTVMADAPHAEGSLAESKEVEAAKEREKANEQLKSQERQRILGVIPQFNVSNLTNAVHLSPGQKMELAFKTAVDPFTFLFAGIDASISQGEDSFPGYGLGVEGYAKRFGASYVDSFDGTMIGNAILPIVLRQDPRYFRKGTGRFVNRFAYAVLSTVRCKSDSGHWQPNYSNVLGNFAAGGISNLYYPSSERGLTQTYQRAIVVSSEGAIGATLAEFWPDISHRFRKRHQRLNRP